MQIESGELEMVLHGVGIILPFVLSAATWSTVFNIPGRGLFCVLYKNKRSFFPQRLLCGCLGHVCENDELTKF